MNGFIGYGLFSHKSGYTQFEKIKRLFSEHASHSWMNEEGRAGILCAATCSFIQDDRYIVAFDGMIYNAHDLSQEVGRSDDAKDGAKLFLHAFCKWGTGALYKIDGQFVVVLYDKQTQEYFLARDRMGAKQLYFSLLSNALTFSTNLKMVWHFDWMNKRIASKGLSCYLTFLSMPAPVTLYEGVYKLPPGFYVCIQANGSYSFHRWYDLLNCVDGASVDLSKKAIAVQEVRATLEQSIKKRIANNDSVGICLSGGVQAALLVEMVQEGGKAINTFHLSHEHADENSRLWARKVAKKYGTNHHELIFSDEDIVSFLKRTQESGYISNAHCMQQFFTATLAKEHGINHLLTSDGASELFSEHSLYKEYTRLHKVWKLTQYYFPHTARKGVYFAARPFYHLRPKHKDVLRSWAHNHSLFDSLQVSFSSEFKDELLESFQENRFDPIIENIYSSFDQTQSAYSGVHYFENYFYQRYPKGDVGALVAYLELMQKIPEYLLADIQYASQSSAVSIESPFLDHTVAELLLQIPVKHKKTLLKRVAEVGLAGQIMPSVVDGDAFQLPKKSKVTHYLHDIIREKKDIFHNARSDDLIKKIALHNNGAQLWAFSALLGVL